MGKFETADYRMKARERWQFARKPHRLEVSGVSHLAYYWGSNGDAFRVCVCVCIVPCVSNRCASHSAGIRGRRASSAGAAGRFRASSGRRHPEEGRACAQGRSEEERAEEEAGRDPNAAAGSGRAGADGRARSRHGRHRQRHGEHVAGRRQRIADRICPDRRRPRQLGRLHPHSRHEHSAAAAVDSPGRLHERLAGQRFPGRRPVSRL